MPSSHSALVLFSGGQDSTTCLGWALNRFDPVETLAFHYGQKHAVELECGRLIREKIKEINPLWKARLGQAYEMNLPSWDYLSTTALTHDLPIEISPQGLPTTFVPGRNLLFFTYAASLATTRGHRHLIGGMCETDFSGYPDCRDDTIKALQVALNLGLEKRFILETPLMWKDKKETWALAHQIGGQAFVDLILHHTHTCYKGIRDQWHEWGTGCGICPACQLRQKGYEAWQTAGSNLLF